MRLKSMAIPAFLSTALLTACGSDGGSANVSQVDLGEPPVFADGSEILPADFDGETFPFYFVEGFRTSPGSTLRRGVGAATVAGNTLVLTIGDGEFIDLLQVSGTFYDTPSGIDFLVENLGVARVVGLDEDSLFGVSDIAGVFGFQTPSAFMPTTDTGTYNFQGYSRVILSETGNDEIVVLESFDTVNLTADFANNEIGGTLFNDFGLVDFDGDDSFDDAFVLFVELANGQISGGTFSASLAADAEVFINDSDRVGLDPVFSNTSADGVFFGNGASLIGGTFEGDYRSRGPDGSFVGYFDVGRASR